MLVIDEPERHLHRAIISPLLKMLFEKRKDCAFIVSTHELMLPLDTPKAATLLLRDCHFNGSGVQAWTIDMLQPGAPIDDQLRQDILGSRRKMIFVEGTRRSLDAPLYSLLFPEVSVVSKETCRDVEYAVRGLRGASEMHWVAAWGIVDNDQRTPENVERLRSAGIWALAHYSVESLYYHSKIIKRVAERQAAMTGADADNLFIAALSNAIAAAKLQKDHLVNAAVLRAARQKLANSLPTRDDIAGGGAIDVHVDVPGLRIAEESYFDALIALANWDGLLTRYPMRESPACDRVVAGLKIVDRETYRATVLKLLQDDEAALSEMRGFLGGLYSEVSAVD